MGVVLQDCRGWVVATLCEVGGIGILAWALGTVLTSGR